MKTLWITEKPNVAGDLAHALGVPKSGADYENDKHVISYCRGHLLALSMPNGSMPLPIIPEEFPLYPSAATKDLYNHLVSLLNRKDIAMVVNACDCAREGEAIFRYVYDASGSKLPRKRLWINSTDVESYQRGAQNLLDGHEKDNLFEAAFCRNKADWLIGLNGSRSSGISTGRVMTPTLYFVVDAYRKNKYFIPQDYYELDGQFQAQNGSYTSRLYDQDGVKVRKFNSKDELQTFLASIDLSLPCDVKDVEKPSFSQAPLLFDMSELQKTIYKKFKIKVEESAEILQSLYDEYKLITYPRSDFNAFPEHYGTEVIGILKSLQHIPLFSEYAKTILENNWVNVRDKRIFDNNRVDDHFAITPTGKVRPNPKEKRDFLFNETNANLEEILPKNHFLIYQLIVQRTLAIFFPKAEYSSSSRITTHPNGSIFKTNGKVLKNPGWLAVYGGKDEDEDNKKEKASKLIALQPNEKVKLSQWKQHDLKTKAPPLLNDATLLEKMKTAGKTIDDEELSQMIMQKGLGTSATRTEIIKKLKQETVNKTTGKKRPAQIMEGRGVNGEVGYIPTNLGLVIADFWEQTQPELINPILTAEWENQLDKVAKGSMTSEEFMDNIVAFTRNMVSSAQSKREEMTEILCDCPVCQSGQLQGTSFSWRCNNCSFVIPKKIAQKELSKDILLELAQKGCTEKEIDGFVSTKKGTKFSAKLKIIEDDEAVGGKKVVFDFPERVDKKYDLPCPKCHSELTENDFFIKCTSCEVQIWKKIAGVTLTSIQLKEIIQGRPTKELNMVSKSKKSFKAKVYFDKAQNGLGLIFANNKK